MDIPLKFAGDEILVSSPPDFVYSNRSMIISFIASEMAGQIKWDTIKKLLFLEIRGGTAFFRESTNCQLPISSFTPFTHLFHIPSLFFRQQRPPPVFHFSHTLFSSFPFRSFLSGCSFLSLLFQHGPFFGMFKDRYTGCISPSNCVQW